MRRSVYGEARFGSKGPHAPASPPVVEEPVDPALIRAGLSPTVISIIGWTISVSLTLSR
ncbi:hypothetical protein M8494_22800 [Serratia ureilytica]